MNLIPGDLYAEIERSIPMVCVDFLLVRRDGAGQVSEVGLIRRGSPFGEVWCHLGGRIRFGETVADALRRHMSETVDGAVTDIPDDPQPTLVYQWFPDEVAPASTLAFGRDPRKHSVSLCFTLDVDGTPVARAGGEALTFRFWPVNDLPADLWPGCQPLFERLLA
jgi:ADP-ribose pyrophosphatase YjhB (NUDIX family)